MLGAVLRLNDTVEVVSGEHARNSGAVLSIERLEPEPVYLVELANPPADAQIPENDLSAS
ncbi:MAG: hypothetical protein Rubg2KO_37240 [Rubricoccaceae bacterium]